MDTLDLLALITDSMPQNLADFGAPSDSPADNPMDLGLPPDAALERQMSMATRTPMAEVNRLVEGESGGIPTNSELYQRTMGGWPGGSRGGSRRPIGRIPAPPRGRVSRGTSTRAGIDFSNLDLGEMLFLVLHPQGPQIIGMMSQAQQEKERTAIMQAQMRQQSEQQRRANTLADLDIQMRMNQIGAIPAEPGLVGNLRAGLGRGQMVNAPGGRYIVPTAEKQRERAKQAMRDEAMTKAEIAAEVKKKYEPHVNLHPKIIQALGLGWQRRVPISEAEGYVRQFNATKAAADEKIQAFLNNDGTITVLRVGPDSASTQTLPGGPVKPTDGGGLTGWQQHQQQRQQQADDEKHAKDVRDTRDRVQALIDKAKLADQARIEGGEGAYDPGSGAEWKIARDAGAQAERDFPGEIESRDSNGYPYVKILKINKTAGTKSAPSAAGSPQQNLSLAKQKMLHALEVYRKMTPEQRNAEKNGITPKSWFNREFGLDPDYLLQNPNAFNE